MDKPIVKKPEVKAPPKKQYYIVHVESLAPVITEYKVLAETPEQAYLAVRQRQVPQVKPHVDFAKARPVKTLVIDYVTRVVKLLK